MLTLEELKYEKPSLAELYISPAIACGAGTSSGENYADPGDDNDGDVIIEEEEV